MRIANPLYDNAFKYLMSNDRLARKVLSVILDREVLDLELTQQEVVVEDNERQFTLYRLDFKARIRTENGGTEIVLIELQKSKLPTNVLRFRSYLSAAYSHHSKKSKLSPAAAGQPAGSNPALPRIEQEPVYPIISIYIMGYNIEDLPVMAAKVDRKVIDISEKKELDINSDFVNLLTHTCYVLQIRRLPKERRTRIEQFLTLFNQAWISDQNYILDLEEVPEEFADIAKHLQTPLLEEDMRNKLLAEQELEELFAIQEAEVKILMQQIDGIRSEYEEVKARAEEQRARAEEERARAEEEKARAEEQKARAEEQRARADEEKAKAEEERRQKQAAIRLMRESGIPIEQIARVLGIDPQEAKG